MYKLNTIELLFITLLAVGQLACSSIPNLPQEEPSEPVATKQEVEPTDITPTVILEPTPIQPEPNVTSRPTSSASAIIPTPTIPVLGTPLTHTAIEVDPREIAQKEYKGKAVSDLTLLIVSESELNRNLPDNILKEVNFFGSGGAGSISWHDICDSRYEGELNIYKKVQFTNHEDSIFPKRYNDISNPFMFIGLVTCEWEIGDEITLLVRGPQKFEDSVSLTIDKQNSEGSFQTRHLDNNSLVTKYFVPINIPIGQLDFELSGKARKFNHSFTIEKPILPQVFWGSNQGELIFYNFYPHETINIYDYEIESKICGDKTAYGGCFKFHHQLIADQNGNLRATFQEEISSHPFIYSESMGLIRLNYAPAPLFVIYSKVLSETEAEFFLDTEEIRNPNHNPYLPPPTPIKPDYILPSGTPVKIIGFSGGFYSYGGAYHVELTDGTIGWVNKSELEPIPTFYECKGAPKSRLNLFFKAIVSGKNKESILIYNDPTSKRVIGELPIHSQFQIVSQPICIDELVWWGIRTDDEQGGWVAEGNLQEYWIEPVE